MKRLGLLFCVVGIAAALLVFGCSREPGTVTGPPSDGSAGPAPLMRIAAGAEIVPGSYIVVFKPTVGDVDQAVDDLSLREGITARFRYRHALKGFAANLSATEVQALRNDPRIEYIEEDQIARAIGIQTNPPSWGLDRVDQRSLPRDYTYNYNQTGTGVNAYIIDTGIRFTHVDFGGRAVTGYDAITPGGNASDGNGHGTHVAGTTGGAAYGIAKNVRLIAVRVLDNSGSGTYTQVIAGIDWVTGHHTTPAVANMSLGGGASTSLDAAVRNSIADGVTYCVAAGNNGRNASNYSPARVAEAITVGATDSSDRWASFSNYGSVLDILAPGVSIKSDYYTSDTATATMSGTSMATPHVTGAAALYLEANPNASPAEVASGLVALGTPGVISGVPTGTVNLLLYTLIGPVTPPDPPAPPVLSSPANGATGVSTSPTLSWEASSGATSYQVQVSTSSSFTSTVYDQSVTTTSTTVAGLLANTRYYWRVNASNTGGESSWSDVWSFTTQTAGGSAPPAPTLVSPANGASNVSRTPTLTWNAASGADSYRVQVSTRSNFSKIVFDQSDLTDTSVTLPELGRLTKYYWHVSATNDYGTSPYSATWSFRTGR